MIESGDVWLVTGEGRRGMVVTGEGHGLRREGERGDDLF